ILDAGDARETEVDQLHLEVGVDEHVARMDVGVDHLSGVEARVGIKDGYAEAEDGATGIGISCAAATGSERRPITSRTPFQDGIAASLGDAVSDELRTDFAVQKLENGGFAVEHTRRFFAGVGTQDFESGLIAAGGADFVELGVFEGLNDAYD